MLGGEEAVLNEYKKVCRFNGESSKIRTSSNFVTIEWYVELELVFGKLSEIRWLRRH